MLLLVVTTTGGCTDMFTKRHLEEQFSIEYVEKSTVHGHVCMSIILSKIICLPGHFHMSGE